MRNLYTKCSFAQGVGYTTSLREAGIGPEASNDIKPNNRLGDANPFRTTLFDCFCYYSNLKN